MKLIKWWLDNRAKANYYLWFTLMVLNLGTAVLAAFVQRAYDIPELTGIIWYEGIMGILCFLMLSYWKFRINQDEEIRQRRLGRPGRRDVRGDNQEKEPKE